MPSSLAPATLTVAERTHELARLLAAGLLRLRRPLPHLVKEFTTHYHEERPHQGRGNVPLTVADPELPTVLPFPTGEVVCRERLGGLLKHYSRAAA